MSSTNSDILYWIGANPPANPSAPYNFDVSSNWFDATTGALATAPPTDHNDTIVFGAGHHVVETGGVLSGAGGLVALTNSTLDLTSPFGPGSWFFDNITELPGASVGLFGGLYAGRVVLEPGATLNVSHEYGPSHSYPVEENPTRIGTLINEGGNFVVGDDAAFRLGTITTEHPSFIQNDGGRADPYEDSSADTQYLGALTPTGGVAPGESVIPFASGLYIDLGAIARGSHLDPLNIAVAAPVAGGHVTAVAGGGFTADLVPIPTPGGPVDFDQVGTFAPDTSKLGSHTMIAELAGGGAPTQTLIITDRVV